jgi:hypothetical protein
MDYFLSGHGGSDQLETYTLKFNLVTFCAFGSTLDIPTSWRVFDALATGDRAGLAPYIYRKYGSGETVPSMTLYPTKDFTSGIFKVGGGKIALRSLDGGQFTLRDFESFYHDGETIYWVACLS